MRENNQIIKPGDNDGLRSTQYLQCFAIFCGLGCQMSPYTLLSKEASAWKGFHKSAELSNIFNSFQNFWKPPLTLNQLHQHRGPCQGKISFDIPLDIDIARIWYPLILHLTLILKLWGHFRTWYLLMFLQWFWWSLSKPPDCKAEPRYLCYDHFSTFQWQPSWASFSTLLHFISLKSGLWNIDDQCWEC